MWMITAILFATLAALLYLRQRHLLHKIDELAACAERRQPLLLEHRGSIVTTRKLERLHDAVNGLISDSRVGEDRDRDYLRQIETTLGSIREAVLIVDDGNYVRMANDAARQLIGMDKTLLGRRLESLVQSAGFLDYVRAIRGGARSANEAVEIQRDGAALWFEVNGTPLPRQKDGQRLSLFVLHDITQLKALERMRTEFVANVSHELRTPVTIIKGFSDTLLEDSELSPQERDRFLQKIQKNVIRLHHLLEDLLTLSRMESKADPLQRERQSLNTLVTEICDNFRGRMPEGQVLRAELDTGAPPLDLDSLRITQVLENLLDNALRHARDMRHLTVRTSVVGEQVRCYVEDDGCGIPARDLPHIFERFYRVDKGRSRELGGTGLGLSIVKHIVQQHGGSVFAESEPGKGARIGFNLPVPAAVPAARG